MSYMTEANDIAARLRSLPAPAADRRVRGPSAGPSAKNLAVLAFMRKFLAQHDQLPPLRLIARHFGWDSEESAKWHVAALARHGLIEPNVCGKMRFVRVSGGAQ